MTPHQYLNVLVAVVLGMSVVHLLRGLSRVLDVRGHGRPDPVHLLWTVNILGTTVIVWWFNYRWVAAPVWTLPMFLGLLAYAGALFLLSSLLFPVSGDHIQDFGEQFEGNRSRFFKTCLVFQAIDLFGAFLEYRSLGTSPSPARLTLLLAFSVAFIVATRWRSRRFHIALAAGWLLVLLGAVVLGLTGPIVVP